MQQTPVVEAKIQLTPVKDAYDTHEKFWADSDNDIAVPVDPIQIASRMGIDVFTADMSANQDGYIHPVGPNGRPAIFLNRSHSATRMRFTCAHELGHFKDHENRSVDLVRCDRDENAANGQDPAEIYSNRFAAALLMPKEFLVKLHAKNLSLNELAARFNVSPASMKWRLVNLGLAVPA